MNVKAIQKVDALSRLQTNVVTIYHNEYDDVPAFLLDYMIDMTYSDDNCEDLLILITMAWMKYT